jgi:hypothetical protein
MTWMLSRFLSVLIFMQPQPAALKYAAAPAVPLDTPFAGVVVLAVQPGVLGDVQKTTPLVGGSPFLEPSVAAVANWQFNPVGGQGKQPPVSATIVYRARQIFSSVGAIEFPEWQLAPDRPPTPRVIVEPIYPVNSIAEGVVIFQLKISPEGLIDDIATVQDVPSLTDAARKAVQGWTFSPGTIASKPAAGTAIVAISFLRPIV